MEFTLLYNLDVLPSSHNINLSPFLLKNQTDQTLEIISAGILLIDYETG